MEAEALAPKDVMLGNFIYNMNFVEMVTGIVKTGPKDWQITHGNWNGNSNPMPEGVLYSVFPIPLTDKWRQCLKIDKFELPKWVEYVHQAQNYMKWYANVDLLENIDWELFKTCD